MRVAFIGGALAGGGAERTLTWLAAACGRGGHEPHVVALDAGRHAETAPGVLVHGLDLAGDSAGIWQALLRNRTRVQAIRRVLRDIRPDVVVSFLPEVNVLTLLAAKPVGLPVIVSERTDPRRHSLRWPWSLLRRSLYPSAAAVVVQTEGVAEWTRSFCAPDRVHVIPNATVARPAAVAAPAPAPAWLPVGPFVLGVGRLSREKGFDLLLHAFARFLPLHPEWSLVVLGEGVERAGLESLVSASGLQGRVLLPGFVAPVEPAYAHATCFVLPSRYEGFPNALLEAMRAGLPVASFDCDSGPREIVQHERNGLLVPPERVDLLAEAMARLADDVPLRRRLAAAAPRVVDRFDEARVIAAWDALISAVAGRQRPARAAMAGVPPGEPDV